MEGIRHLSDTALPMERRPLFIYGAGGFGREIMGWIEQDADNLPYRFAGFIDDDVSSLKNFGIEAPVAALDDVAAAHSNALFLPAIGAGKLRSNIVETAIAAGLEPASFVHSSVVMGPRVRIGTGCLIMPGTILTCDIDVGDFAIINCSCNIGHDVVIGSFTTLLGGNQVNGSVKIGTFVTLGAGAIVHPRKSVGDQATVGIGSVVIRSVAAGRTVFGVPAKSI